MKRLVGFLSFWLLISTAAPAQTFRGTILGTVTDSQGAVVTGAKVTARNVNTGLERSTTTTTDGSYAIPELPIGTYTVTVSQSGFQTSETSNVAVEVAGEKRVDVGLRAGQIATTVQVSGETLPQVETTSNTLGGGFENKQIVDLPINGRDFTKMLIMVPGAAGEPNGGGDSPGSFGLFSANGSRGRANNFLLDGTDMNDGYRNLPAINQGGVFGTPGTVLPLDSVAELKVLSNFEAEYGRNSGAVVDIVTKSGTNAFHGTAYEDFRNAALNARNFFNSAGPKDAFRNNQFGGAIGGPIVKNKTFFYLAYEGQRQGLAITSLNVVPTLNANPTNNPNSPATPANDYAQAVQAIGGDPSQCNTTVINCIRNQPAGVINPVILNFFNLCDASGKCSGGKNIWPLPNFANASAGSANSSDPAAATNDVDSMIVKLDQNLGKSQLSGRYFFGNSNQSFPLGLAGGNNLPSTNTFAPIRTQLVSLSLVTVLKPNQTNEARLGWNRYRNGFYAADRSVFGNPEQTLHMDTGVTSSNDYGLPTIRFGQLSALGSSPFSNPRNRVDTNWQFFDNYTWVVGKHNLKTGFEFRRTAVDSFNDFSGRGVMIFNNLSDFLSGMFSNTVLFSSRQQVGNTNRSAMQNNAGLYLQDSIRLTNRLTVNAGLRWDYFGVIHEAQGLLTAYDFTQGIVARKPLYDKDLNNFAPRLSFAWDVTGKGKTVVRSGFGVFYDDFSQDAFTGQIYENSFNIGVAYNPVPNAPVQIFKPDRSIPLQPDVPIFTCPTCSDATSDVSTVPQHMRTPYVYNYNLNLQQQLFPQAVFEVGYVGSAGRKLLRLRDLNQPTQAQITAADLACTCINDGVLRKYSNLANMSSLEPFAPFYLNQLEASGTSNYNSLQVSLTQQSFHGLTQQIAYTWAHSIDTASDSQDFVPNASMPQNSNNVLGDKGPSNYDTRNRLVWASTYDLPKWGSHDKLGAGWSVSGVFSLISGHPFSMNYNFIDDFSGGAEFYDRPDVVGPIHYNYSNPYSFLNLNSFQVPCNFNWAGNLQDGFADSCQPGTRHYGNLGRNGLLGPHYRNFDFALSKTTALTERWKIMLRADFFNLTNHPNFANPLAVSFFADAAPNRSGNFPTGIDPLTGRNIGFSQITATSDVGLGNPVLGGGGQRSIQLSLKLMF
jgi:hypothetical protein